MYILFGNINTQDPTGALSFCGLDDAIKYGELNCRNFYIYHDGRVVFWENVRR